MATSQSTMDFLLDILSDSKQVSARKMFGEYCLYYAGRPVGLVCGEQLYLKHTDAGKRLMKTLTEGAPFPGARPHLRVSPDDWDDRSWLNALVRATFDSLPAPKQTRAPQPRNKAPANATSAAALAALPNLGPKSQAMLVSAHIESVASLRKLGAVAAYALVKQTHRHASLNLLWALEGALSGLPWQVVAREHRTSLLLALEQHQTAKLPATGRKPKNG